MKEHPGNTIQNNQDVCRIANNTLESTSFLVHKLTTDSRGFLSLWTSLWMSWWRMSHCCSTYITCFISLIGYMTVKWRPEVVSLASIETAPFIKMSTNLWVDLYINHLMTKNLVQIHEHHTMNIRICDSKNVCIFMNANHDWLHTPGTHYAA